jgi:uncharacterized membrane protein YozB (DUF420 family)
MSIRIGVRKNIGNGVSVGMYFLIQHLFWLIIAIPFVLSVIYFGFSMLYQHAMTGDIQAIMMIASFILAPIIFAIIYNYQYIVNIYRAFMTGWNSK